MLSDEEILQRYEEINAEIRGSVLGDVACAACKHWVESDPCEFLIKRLATGHTKPLVTWKGRCHLNPPTAVSNRNDWDDASQFPETNANDHCSHFLRSE